MDFDKLDELNIINSRNKKKTFTYITDKGVKFVVRTVYGIKEAGVCCGMGCRYCIYGCEKDGTKVLKNFEW